MKRSIVFPVLLFLGLAPAVLHAEEAVSWRGCVMEARARHPDLASSRALLRQAEAERLLAGSTLLPSLGVTGSVTTGGTVGSGASGASSLFSYSVTARQLLYDGRKNSKLRDASAESVKARESSMAGVSADVRFVLRSAFTELLKAQEMVELSSDIALRRKNNARLIALRYRAGREHIGSLRRAEADLAAAEFEVAQASRGLVLARCVLSSALGRRERSPLRVAGSFTAPVPETRLAPDFQAIARRNPLVVELEAVRNAAGYSLAAAESAFAPELYLRSSAGRSETSDWPPENVSLHAGVELVVPIYEGGAGRARVAGARAALSGKDAAVESGMLQVLDLLEASWKQFVDARERLTVQKKYLDAAVERSSIADAQYSNGLISFDDWVIIEDNLVSAKKEFLNAGGNLWIAEAQWIQAKGGGLDEVVD
ncbi:TolC family protein [Pelodictyon luteolum]|uniref:FusA/NodT family protein n=1 Tax=Chlorobium luteolum (strain DSM 273 / BCRC 81028 / 2530) TaxID=319225 RepID=Q3B5J9_CHLL3|nr:TolC family protein [Pelodictyon luteolum]ABB23382.1 FusA/NodT family protein [Pelodictyon luteolum DSM 273]